MASFFQRDGGEGVYAEEDKQQRLAAEHEVGECPGTRCVKAIDAEGKYHRYLPWAPYLPMM